MDELPLSAHELLSPERIGPANAGHGVAVTRMPDGATLVTCTKSIESECRAMMVQIPYLMRIDLRPHQDTVQVLVRKLYPDAGAFGYGFGGQVGWRGSDTLPPPKDSSIPTEVRVYSEVPGAAVLGDFLVGTNWESRAQVVHVSMRGLLRGVDPGTITLH